MFALRVSVAGVWRRKFAPGTQPVGTRRNMTSPLARKKGLYVEPIADEVSFTTKSVIRLTA
jgi:hypothetical protein